MALIRTQMELLALHVARIRSLCFNVSTGSHVNTRNKLGSGKQMRCVWWVIDGTRGFASPQLIHADRCRMTTLKPNQATSSVCMVRPFLLLLQTTSRSAAAAARVAMAMRVATRRVADQLRCSPTILNGTRLFQNSGPDAQQGAPKPVPMSKLKDSFLDGTSSTYLEDMEERYRQDPSSVDKSWASFFRSLGTPTHGAMRAKYCSA